MILIDMYDMVGWWSLVIALHVVIITTYFLFSMKQSKRTKHTSQQPTMDWNPLPLVGQDIELEKPPVMRKIDDGVLNVGATSFLSLDKESTIVESAIKCIDRYGVGSCGPRGFYGTIDVHLQLEEKLAKFLEVEETCVYSYGFATIASAIPSYAKKGDIIFADDGVSFAIQKGIEGSRSNVHYFKHNDMKHLEEMLKEAKRNRQLNPKRRAFLIAEGIYYNSGDLCPLNKLVELARKYKLRIILDESLSIGVLGKNGRGLTEHLNVPREEIDLIVGSLEHSFASIGGFCAGSHFIVEHQRLSGLGYCFSASLPPMLTQAAISGVDILQSKPNILKELEDVCKKIHVALSKLQNYRIAGDEVSPIKHVYIKREDLSDSFKQTHLRNISDYCMENGIAMSVCSYLRDAEVNCPEPSIRIAASRKIQDSDIVRICCVLEEAYEKVGPQPDWCPVGQA